MPRLFEKQSVFISYGMPVNFNHNFQMLNMHTPDIQTVLQQNEKQWFLDEIKKSVANYSDWMGVHPDIALAKIIWNFIRNMKSLLSVCSSQNFNSPKDNLRNYYTDIPVLKEEINDFLINPKVKNGMKSALNWNRGVRALKVGLFPLVIAGWALNIVGCIIMCRNPDSDSNPLTKLLIESRSDVIQAKYKKLKLK